jgi:hypothetical protein
MRTIWLASIVVGLALATGASAEAKGLHTYIGSLHEHSAYSDGWPGSRPADIYSSGARHGLDFMGGSDHSDNTGLPFSFSAYCTDPTDAQYNPTQAGCLDADAVHPADAFRKWDATGGAGTRGDDASLHRLLRLRNGRRTVSDTSTFTSPPTGRTRKPTAATST